MERRITGVAALMGMIAIILGAFGAHALKKQLSVEQINAFETGVKISNVSCTVFIVFGAKLICK